MNGCFGDLTVGDKADMAQNLFGIIEKVLGIQSLLINP